MDEAPASEDEPSLLTLELVLLDLTWIRLPKVDQDQLIIPTLCFKVLDFPLVTFSPQHEPADSKDKLVSYNQGKSCIFRTSLELLSQQFTTYPIYSFLMDTGCQPAPMVAFGSFPLQAIIEDIASFTKVGCTDWPTVSAQHGQAYLRNTRGKRVALINFALRLSCLSDCGGGGGGGVSGATGEPAAAPAQRPVLVPAAASGAARWPQWHHPLAAEGSYAGDKGPAEPRELQQSQESFQAVRVVRRAERHPPLPPPQETVSEERIVRLADRYSPEDGFRGDRRVAWGLEQQQQQQQQQQRAQQHLQQQPHQQHLGQQQLQQQQQFQQQWHQQQQHRQYWDGRPDPGGHFNTGPPTSLQHRARLENAAADFPTAPHPHIRPHSAGHHGPPHAARSRSSSAEGRHDGHPGGTDVGGGGADGGGGSCWRAPLETDEGSLASDASSGPIVTRLIQELAAMQRATSDSRHVAVQTRPLRELLRGLPPPPPAPIAPIRGRRRPRPPRIRRLPLISEEPVTEGFARRRPAASALPRRPPAPPPDTTAVDRLSRGQPVSERRGVSGRPRAPPVRLRPVTLTRTAQLRLARHMADVRHDLHAQEYGRRRDRWLAEQRRRMGRSRLPLPPAEMFPSPAQTPPHSGRVAPVRKRRGGSAAARGPPAAAAAAAMKSIGVQFESDGSPPPTRRSVKSAKGAAAAAVAKAADVKDDVSPPTSFVEPRLSSSQQRAGVGDLRSSPSAVKTPPDALNSTTGRSSHSRGSGIETLSPSGDRGSAHSARRCKSDTAARGSDPDPSSRSGSAARSRSETVARSASPVAPLRSSGGLDPSPGGSSLSAERRRRRESPWSGNRLASDAGKAIGDASNSVGSDSSNSGGGGGGGGGRGGSEAKSKSPTISGGGADAVAAGGSAARRSSGDSMSSSTLRTDRHVSEEMVSAPARRSPPSVASSVKTERVAPAVGRRTASSTTATTSSAAPTRADSSQVEEQISASQASTSSGSESSDEDSSDTESTESSSSITEASRTRTQTQTSATQTSSSTERVPVPAKRDGKAPDSGGKPPNSGGKSKSSPGAGAKPKPKPAPRGPPTWQRVDETPAAAAVSKPLPATAAMPAPASPPAATPAAAVARRRSRSSSRDSAEIDARIAMFLKQSGEKQREREEQDRKRQQEQETAAVAAPAGAGWLKSSSAAALIGGSGVGGGSVSRGGGGTGAGVGSVGGISGGGVSASGGGGGTSWLKAWKVDDDSAPPPSGPRRTSRGRHTMSHTAAGLNTDSVSSYAPSELEGGTLSDLTPP